MDNYTTDKWINVIDSKPKPYEIVQAKGKWKCKKLLYLDDDENGWEQKIKGNIQVTHWKPKKNLRGKFNDKLPMETKSYFEELGIKAGYFDKQGNPIELLDWANLFEDPNYKIVKQEVVGKYLVSTVWLGMNMSSFRTTPIKIFETIIFSIDDENKKDDPILEHLDRYSTEEEALEGHERAIKIAKGEVSNG